MSNYRFHVTGLSNAVRYRIDTASGSDTPATVVSPNAGNTILNSIVQSDYNGGGVDFVGTAATYYLKQMNPVDNTLLAGATPITVTGVLLNDPITATNIGVATQAAQSGAVTVALAQASVVVLMLTGNVTSWVFSGLGRSGQEVEVHFVQDATGSRTLTGADATIKLAGGALTLTTTANKRDVIRVRQIAGVFYEQSRSLNQ